MHIPKSNDAHLRAPRRSVTEVSHSDFHELERRLDQQALLLQALAKLLLEKGVVSEPELKQWMERVDAEDGARDGRRRRKGGVVLCPKCARKSRAGSTSCQFCGAELPREAIA